MSDTQAQPGAGAGLGRGVRPPPAATPLKSGDRLTRSEFERRYSARPDIKKAELIEGIVRMPSPVRYEAHAKPHAALCGPLMVYAAHTPGVGVADNATIRLDADNVPQPDVLLRIESAAIGQSTVDADGYVEGAPELVAEIAAASASPDLRDRLNLYRRHGVREYIVWQTYAKRIDWFELTGDAYRPLPANAGGIVSSRVFPGLQLAVTALLDGDVATALTRARQGIDRVEHGAFVAQLDGGPRAL